MKMLCSVAEPKFREKFSEFGILSFKSKSLYRAETAGQPSSSLAHDDIEFLGLHKVSMYALLA